MCREWAKIPLLSQPVRPELLGCKFSLVLGQSSGPLGLAVRLTELGLPSLSDDGAVRALAAVERYAETHRSVVPDEELVVIVGALDGGDAV